MSADFVSQWILDRFGSGAVADIIGGVNQDTVEGLFRDDPAAAVADVAGSIVRSVVGADPVASEPGPSPADPSGRRAPGPGNRPLGTPAEPATPVLPGGRRAPGPDPGTKAPPGGDRRAPGPGDALLASLQDLWDDVVTTVQPFQPVNATPATEAGGVDYLQLALDPLRGFSGRPEGGSPAAPAAGSPTSTQPGGKAAQDARIAESIAVGSTQPGGKIGPPLGTAPAGSPVDYFELALDALRGFKEPVPAAPPIPTQPGGKASPEVPVSPVVAGPAAPVIVPPTLSSKNGTGGATQPGPTQSTKR